MRLVFSPGSTKVCSPQAESIRSPEVQSKMKKIRFAFLSLAALAVLSLSLSTPIRYAQAQKNGDGGGGAPLVYPETKKVDVVEDYFGTKVADPYRWLEDNDSPAVAQWVEAENKVTFAYLA